MNKYTVYSCNPQLRLPEFITFTSSELGGLPAPSPEYLAIHAACCKVVQFSGVSDYIYDVWDLDEEIHDGVLPEPSEDDYGGQFGWFKSLIKLQ